MKRDKEWAKEQLEYYIKAVGTPFNYRTQVMIDAYKNVEHIINQLDEPEVLSQEWIEENSLGAFELEGTLDDTDERFVSEDELQNLLVPKQELLVVPEPLIVPKHIGEWLDKQDLGYEAGLFSMILELKDLWAERGFDDFINCNKKQLIEVILDKREYKVEEQKLYYIKVSEHQYVQWLDEDNVKLMLVSDEAFAGLFTEQEIKKINPNLMTLAVEVTK